jgi:hypothetical protein
MISSGLNRPAAIVTLSSGSEMDRTFPVHISLCGIQCFSLMENEDGI